MVFSGLPNRVAKAIQFVTSRLQLANSLGRFLDGEHPEMKSVLKVAWGPTAAPELNFLFSQVEHQVSGDEHHFLFR